MKKVTISREVFEENDPGEGNLAVSGVVTFLNDKGECNAEATLFTIEYDHGWDYYDVCGLSDKDLEIAMEALMDAAEIELKKGNYELCTHH